MSHGNGYDPCKHVQVPLALIVPQPLHFARMNGYGLLVVVHMIGRQTSLAEGLQFFVGRSFVVRGGKVAFRQLGSVRNGRGRGTEELRDLPLIVSAYGGWTEVSFYFISFKCDAVGNP